MARASRKQTHHEMGCPVSPDFGTPAARYSEATMTSSAKPLRRVAVFCGSAFGNNPAFRAEATALGAAIAKAGLGWSMAERAAA